MTTKTLEKSMTLQERVMQALLSYGQKEIYLTYDDLMGKTGIPSRSAIYQALHRMSTLYSEHGALEMITEKTPDVNGVMRNKFIGVKILKAEPRSSTLERMKGRAAARVEQIEAVSNKGGVSNKSIAAKFPSLLLYMNKKLAIEKAKEMLKESGVDTEKVIHFDPDEVAEEGILLLRELIDANKKISQLEIDVAARDSDLRYMRKENK